MEYITIVFLPFPSLSIHLSIPPSLHPPSFPPFSRLPPGLACALFVPSIFFECGEISPVGYFGLWRNVESKSSLRCPGYCSRTHILLAWGRLPTFVWPPCSEDSQFFVRLFYLSTYTNPYIRYAQVYAKLYSDYLLFVAFLFNAQSQ